MRYRDLSEQSFATGCGGIGSGDPCSEAGMTTWVPAFAGKGAKARATGPSGAPDTSRHEMCACGRWPTALAGLIEGSPAAATGAARRPAALRTGNS